MAPYSSGDPGPELGHLTGTNYWRGQVRHTDEYDVTITVVGTQLKSGSRISDKVQIHDAIDSSHALIPALPVVILLG